MKRAAIAMALFAILTAAYAVPPVPIALEQAALILDDTTVGNIDDYDLPTADPEICGPLLQCK